MDKHFAIDIKVQLSKQLSNGLKEHLMRQLYWRLIGQLLDRNENEVERQLIEELNG